MAESITFAVPGTLGNIAGSGSDGVLIGMLAAKNPTAVLLKTAKDDPLCFTDDGGLYVDETAAIASATADDVELLPATPAVDDAAYFGHATHTFATLSLNLTTAGDGTWTIAWEYWNGTAWTALADVVDDTAAFEAATGWHDVAFTLPADWAKCTVDQINGYWIRARVSAYSAITTAPQAGQGTVTVSNLYVDDTVDFTDVGAGDVKLLPTTPTVGDGLYIGYSEKFCKIKIVTSQARTGTATIALKYWNGSAWAAVSVVDDDSAGYSATAGTHLIHFVPPADWVANTVANGPDGREGFFVVMELTALTDVTQAPLATQGWVYPLKTGAAGVTSPGSGTSCVVDMDAQTASGNTADSVFLLVNVTRGTHIAMTWPKTLGHASTSGALTVNPSDQLALVQIMEDGTTELANANFTMCV